MEGRSLLGCEIATADILIDGWQVVHKALLRQSLRQGGWDMYQARTSHGFLSALRDLLDADAQLCSNSVEFRVDYV